MYKKYNVLVPTWLETQGKHTMNINMFTGSIGSGKFYVPQSGRLQNELGC